MAFLPMAPDPEPMSDSSPDLAALREAIVSGDPSRAMPALAGLRDREAAEAIPLLLLGLEQRPFIIRSLACAGLGVKRSEQGWQALSAALRGDEDANVRAEAANSLANYGVVRAWPLLREAFAADGQWLVRCSILSALAEQPEMAAAWLLELARMALADSDGTVRVGGCEILGRLLRQAPEAIATNAITPDAIATDAITPDAIAVEAREALREARSDADHRVVAAALDGLQPC